MSFPGQRNERARSALAVTISEEPGVAVAAISGIIKPAILAFLHGTFRWGSSRLCCDARGGGRTRWCSHAPLIPMPRCASDNLADLVAEGRSIKRGYLPAIHPEQSCFLGADDRIVSVCCSLRNARQVFDPMTSQAMSGMDNAQRVRGSLLLRMSGAFD